MYKYEYVVMRFVNVFFLHLFPWSTPILQFFDRLTFFHFSSFRVYLCACCNKTIISASRTSKCFSLKIMFYTRSYRDIFICIFANGMFSNNTYMYL